MMIRSGDFSQTDTTVQPRGRHILISLLNIFKIISPFGPNAVSFLSFPFHVRVAVPGSPLRIIAGSLNGTN